MMSDESPTWVVQESSHGKDASMVNERVNPKEQALIAKIARDFLFRAGLFVVVATVLNLVWPTSFFGIIVAVILLVLVVRSVILFYSKKRHL